MALNAPGTLEQVSVQKPVVQNQGLCLDYRWRKGASFLQQLGLKVLIQRRLAAELRETNLK